MERSIGAFSASPVIAISAELKSEQRRDWSHTVTASLQNSRLCIYGACLDVRVFMTCQPARHARGHARRILADDLLGWGVA